MYIWKRPRQPKQIFTFYPTSYTYLYTPRGTHKPALCYGEKPVRQWILLNNNNHYTRDRATHHTCTVHCLCFLSLSLALSLSLFYYRTLPSHVTCTPARTRTRTCVYMESTHMCHDDRTHSFKIHSSQFSRLNVAFNMSSVRSCRNDFFTTPPPSPNLIESFRIIYYNNFTVSIQFFSSFFAHSIHLFPHLIAIFGRLNDSKKNEVRKIDINFRLEIVVTLPYGFHTFMFIHRK